MFNFLIQLNPFRWWLIPNGNISHDNDIHIEATWLFLCIVITIEYPHNIDNYYEDHHASLEVSAREIITPDKMTNEQMERLKAQEKDHWNKYRELLQQIKKEQDESI